MSAINIIQKLARKLLARESKGITKIPTTMSAEAKAGEIAARLQDAGLPLNRVDDFIKSEVNPNITEGFAQGGGVGTLFKRKAM